MPNRTEQMISGQVIAITGASSGIGRATALHLAKGGAKVVLGARHEEGLQNWLTRSELQVVKPSLD